ncbi:MAG: hypothetical protein Q9213_001828 [Squamulea squamosa]
MRKSLVFWQLSLLSLPSAALLPRCHYTEGAATAEHKTKYWIWNKACTWFDTCAKPQRCDHASSDQDLNVQKSYSNVGKLSASTTPANFSDQPEDIPDYVLDFAPLVHLHSGEKFWPCDIAEHLDHVTPCLNYTPMSANSISLNLTNLDKLNKYTHGRFVYLTSNDNVEERPGWLEGEKNIPIDPGEFYKVAHDSRNQQPLRNNGAEEMHGGRSDAPAVLVVVNKGHGIVDAFWFFFYSYNLGNLVFNIRFGNHVGDWEHCLVRFIDGKPKYVFVSEHYFGQAYTYSAVEKLGKRVSEEPPPYKQHSLIMLEACHLLRYRHACHTDRGPLWDPTLNSFTYTYDHTSDVLLASNVTPRAPIEWFYFNGHWGDKFYPVNDDRQYRFAGQYHYVNGPLGPRFKHLGRKKVCQGRTTDPCVIHYWLPPERTIAAKGSGEGEDWKEDETDPPGLPSA